MISKEPNPPKWAEAILRSILTPSDRESISGDLLEEYREVRYQALGPFQADVWYIKHVASVFWPLMWRCALPMVPLTLLPLAARLPWNINLVQVQAPGLTLLHAMVYLWAGYYGAQRTRLIRTGLLTAGTTSFFGFVMLFTFFAIRDPRLLAAPFSKPFIFVILLTLLSIALGFGVAVGAVGAVVGRWLPPASRRHVRAS
ncbi:MAG TPA: permease prefix domain 2-containing transporter [Vicinamibacterales bacterium]|jgi:hypothetical protein|nr:permease prefix domain 2-containing transporter [Vicinamibacterales bacterium]